MSLNCDSQFRRVLMHHRSARLETDCAPRTSRLSSLPLLLSNPSFRQGIPRSAKQSYAAMRSSENWGPIGRWVGKVRGERSSVMEITNPLLNLINVVDPRSQANQGYGAPRATIFLFLALPTSVSRRGGTELADKTQRSRFPLDRRGASQAHDSLIAGWVGKWAFHSS